VVLIETLVFSLPSGALHDKVQRKQKTNDDFLK
jgi:hypothetical protein